MTQHEKRALARIYLGGIEALRTESYRCHTSTVEALYRKALLDKQGLTESGKLLAKQLADSGIV